MEPTLNAEDSIIMCSGEEVDEHPDFIPEQSVFTVAAEMEGEPVEELSSPITPAGLEE